MTLLSILSSVLPLLILGGIVWILLRSRQPRKGKPAKADHSTRQGRAVWAWAKILASDCGPVDSGGRARVGLELEVHTPGSPPYTAKTTWMVEKDALSYLETGKEISLKIDPLEPKYVYPNAPWAKYME